MGHSVPFENRNVDWQYYGHLHWSLCSGFTLSYRKGTVFNYPHYLYQISESKVTLFDSFELLGAQGVDLRQPLALIYPSYQFLVLWLPRSRHPRLP